MKKTIFTLAIAAMMCLGITSTVHASTSPVETGVETNDNHPKITEFVAKYFPQATVLSVIRDDNEYEVMLSDYTKLDFTLRYDWKKIDCEHSTVYTAVPAELVPVQISNHVKTSFPNQSIVKIDKDRRDWEIELTNDIELKFDRNFNLIEMD